ncbi:MAG: hypothetical protein JXB14_04965 [Candidatus Altiarchaeota archaeon]|nr:hypothetical protein [Candidatus Altiarchaeota archaeon]
MGVRFITPEVATLILVGFLITIVGVFLNFQNLDDADRAYRDYDRLRNNEAVAGLLQVVGIAVIFVGATRGILKRSEVMNNRFINMMEVFTSLVDREMDIIGTKEVQYGSESKKKQELRELAEQTKQLKTELKQMPKDLRGRSAELRSIPRI